MWPKVWKCGNKAKLDLISNKLDLYLGHNVGQSTFHEKQGNVYKPLVGVQMNTTQNV